VDESEEILTAYGAYTLFAAFAALGMGVPLPMLVLFGSLGLLVDSGVLSRQEAVLLVFSATVAGDTGSYLIFYFGGHLVLERIYRRFPAVRPQVERVEKWYRRYGVAAIVVFRWINWGQGQVIWLAGLSRLSPVRFLPVMASVNLAWAAAWTYVGIGSISLIRELAPWFAAALLALAALLAAYLYLARRGRLPLPARLAKILGGPPDSRPASEAPPHSRARRGPA
jgi:membrane protein DedA with SNARE-associated domain